MASVKITFKPSGSNPGEGFIIYHINHARSTRQVLTGYTISAKDWISKRFPLPLRERIQLDTALIRRITSRLEHSQQMFNASDIAEEFTIFRKNYTLLKFLNRLAARLKEKGKLRTYETYTSAARSFSRFLSGPGGIYLLPGEDDIPLDYMSCGMIEDYQIFLERRPVVLNTVSFYMRILRAVYHRAVDDGIISDGNIFRHVYTGIAKTVKRALPIHEIRRITQIDLSSQPALDYARDMFVLSFFLRGMSFVDMAFLRKTDLCNGVLTYRRRKTGQLLSIKWTMEMKAILDKYPRPNSETLLPILRHGDINEFKCYRKKAYCINRNLKRLGKQLDIGIPLTLYVARHSWASAARTKGIPLSVISEGMGHESELTTKIYLASLDTSAVDMANSMILEAVRQADATL